jgi:DNA ligase (NAD+)
MMEELHNLDFEVDGLVIKVNQYDLREKLGNTSKSPRWLIAYKWEKYEAETTIQEITIQVGKTGTLTPVANLEPVQIAGTTVSRASLHNADEINRLEVMIGDRVTVEKAGKIIPHVVRVEKQHRTGIEVPFQFPTHCPECQTSVEKDESGVYIRCPNLSCPARLRESLRYFASRQAMDIEGLGVKLIEQLIENKLLTNLLDIYRLQDRRDELLNLERMGTKSVDNLLIGIEKSKSQPAWRLLTALNIRHVGTRTSQILTKKFGSIKNLATQSAETLSQVHEVGEVIANSVHDFFASIWGIELLQGLESFGLNLGTENLNAEQDVQLGDSHAENGKLKGKTIVVTGALKSKTREEIEELITNLGGKAGSSVSKKTDVLVVGEKAGSKLEKAQQLNIQIMTEADFLNWIS